MTRLPFPTCSLQLRSLLILAVLLHHSWAEESSIRVFVALCDNATQGIQPVGERIGDGNRPNSNLYWGCSDGFDAYFRQSRNWEVVEAREDVTPQVLRRLQLKHRSDDLTLLADAYRGSNLKDCVAAFEKAAASGNHKLVAFIGHNGLMDFHLPEPLSGSGNGTDAVVLCCFSDSYFSPRLRRLGCRPILTTKQLMYPGSFILHDVIEAWRRGRSLSQIRLAAGSAYARNQGISIGAATGVFTELEPE